MKKTIFLAFTAITIIFSGCGKDFLQQDNLYEKDLNNYYANPTDVFEALTGGYSCLAIDEGGNHPTLMANLMSDDCFSGGGTNDIQTIGTDKFENPVEDLYLPIYSRCYAGIFRMNTLITHFDQAQYEDATEQKYNLGEAHFLRAFFYFRLAQIFGEVPLDLNSELEYLPKSKAPEIYAQITSDLVVAIENMPNTPFNQMPAEENGRATKWAAEALMARVYLFYTGYYQKPEGLPLVDGGTISQTQVVTWIEDCINNSGHYLLPDFRSLWPFSLLDNDDNYFYADATVDYLGDGSPESVFAVKYSNDADWGNTGRLANSNQYVLFTSVRAKDYPPFGSGWGIGSVNPQLRDSYEPADPRRNWTIIDNTDPNEGSVNSDYSWGGWNCANETGLWNKKYTNVITKNTEGNYVGVFYELYGGTNNSYQTWNMQDDILIRFSDVLLMAAELGSNSQIYLDRVRSRVGLPSVPYTLAALKAERRHELALEGLRWYDLLRWGDAETAINAGNGIDIHTDNVPTKYKITFNPNRVFVKLPESEIKLSQGQLIQNPGW